MSKKYNVAIMGATGVVGREMLKILEQRNFPVASLRLLASERSVGMKLSYDGSTVPVEVLTHDSFKGVDIVLSSPGASVSKMFSPSAVKAGAVVVDNSSAFRMDNDVPLVVPEVNAHAIKRHKGIIANPNCSTIQMVVALKPLHDAFKIKRVIVSTYQSVSGAGKKGLQALEKEVKDIINGLEIEKPILPKQIAFNLIPQIDVFMDNFYTKEEMKMVNETRKIMEVPNMMVTATCVRVPVFIGHSESVNIETEKKCTREEAIDILGNAPGIKVVDDPSKGEYPLPIMCAGWDDVFVGRIREDESVPCGLNMWVVSDNLRKGAALNAVQIAELL
jgi:aspartate-semialdehyde dehydrogenase